MAIIKKSQYNIDGQPDDSGASSVKRAGGMVLKAKELRYSDVSVKVSAVSSPIDDPAQVQLPSDPTPTDVIHDDLVLPVSPAVEETQPRVHQNRVEEPHVQVNEAQIRSDVMAELESHFNELIESINQLKVARDEVVASVQPQLIDMALLVAEKVIHKQIESDSTVIQSVVQETFDKISGSDRITFKINPEDAGIMAEFQPTIESRLVGVEKIVIQQDATIAKGGCVIETDLGFVDVTIQEKLNLITQTFKKIKASL